MKQPFFSLDLRQPVNQWLSIALVALMCFWVVLYYIVSKASITAGNLIGAVPACEKSC